MVDPEIDHKAKTNHCWVWLGTRVPEFTNIFKKQSLEHCNQIRGFTVEICKGKHANLLSWETKMEMWRIFLKHSPTHYQFMGTQRKPEVLLRKQAQSGVEGHCVNSKLSYIPSSVIADWFKRINLLPFSRYKRSKASKSCCAFELWYR